MKVYLLEYQNDELDRDWVDVFATEEAAIKEGRKLARNLIADFDAKAGEYKIVKTGNKVAINHTETNENTDWWVVVETDLR